MAPDAWQPRLKEEVELHVDEGEAIVLDRAKERAHQLNEVATFILERCDGTRTPSDIVTALVERYDVAAARAEEDAEDLLAQMKALDILV